MKLVLNEWLFHDLGRENGDSAFRQTARFLFTFAESEDILVRPAEERWNKKAYRLMTMTDTRQRLVSQELFRLMQDSDRTVRIQPDDAPAIPQEFLDRLPCEDVYLVKAYISESADLLITTDCGLFSAIREDDGVNCQMRDDFLSRYSACVQPGAPGGPVG